MKNITENIVLKEIEKKTWRATLEDGILDIYFGILVLGIGMSMTFNDIFPNPLVITIMFTIMGIGLMFLLVAKKYITQPRLGKVKFGFKQKARKIKTVIILSINCIILLILYLIRFINPELNLRFPGYLDGLFVGLLFITIPLCFAAFFLQHPRLYLIAILVGLSFFLSDLFSLFIPEPFDVFLAFILISSVITFMGIFYLIKFVRKYPLPKED